MNTYPLLIDGKLIEIDARLDVVNPATGAAFTTCAVADADLMDRAITAAKAAFPAWSSKSWEDRGAPLAVLADRLDVAREDFAQLLTQEQGKPIADARGEVGLVVDFLHYYSTARIAPKTVTDTAERHVSVHRKPLGVIAAICPWNFPLLIAAYKLAPAVVTGNTCVVKPAATTPLTTLWLGKLAADLFPAGVVNVVTDRNDLGAQLSSHPDVAKVTFTGSTATGKRVMQAASNTLKRITLELGGNDAAILLDDETTDDVAQSVFDAAFNLSGQVCTAIKKVYAPRNDYDALCDKLAAIATSVKIGNGQDEDTKIGPIQNPMQIEKVQGFLDIAKRDGKIIAGGEVLASQGYFIQPTIVRDIDENSDLVKEEQFGPVLPVLPYDTLDDVIQTVNDSEYGLGNSVWSADVERAAEVGLKLNSGSVWINRHGYIDPATPFAGAKQSGIGIEMGDEGLKEFTQMQLLVIEKT
ncbi:MAG: aldehyde dehydrogenase family protein [Paracoccaceae bacterium]